MSRSAPKPKKKPVAPKKAKSAPKPAKKETPAAPKTRAVVVEKPTVRTKYTKKLLAKGIDPRNPLIADVNAGIDHVKQTLEKVKEGQGHRRLRFAMKVLEEARAAAIIHISKNVDTAALAPTVIRETGNTKGTEVPGPDIGGEEPNPTVGADGAAPVETNA